MTTNPTNEELIKKIERKQKKIKLLAKEHLKFNVISVYKCKLDTCYFRPRINKLKKEIAKIKQAIGDKR